MDIIDLGWPWRPLCATVAKRCEIGPKLLLITNRKSHIGFQMTWKPFIFNDLEGQYSNRNCIGCSMSSWSRRFYCDKYLQNLCPIFSLFTYSVAVNITSWMSTCDVCYTSVYCSFQDSISLTCMHGTVSPLTNCFLSMTGIRTLGFGRRQYGRPFLATAGLLVWNLIWF